RWAPAAACPRAAAKGEPWAGGRGVVSNARYFPPGAAGLPVPNLVVGGEESGEAIAGDPLEPGNEIAGLDAAFGEIFGQHVDCDPFAGERGDIFSNSRRLRLAPGAEGKTGGILAAHCVIDGVAAQQDGEIGAGRLHGVVQPDNRVVLLLDRRAIGAL